MNEDINSKLKQVIEIQEKALEEADELLERGSKLINNLQKENLQLKEQLSKEK